VKRIGLISDTHGWLDEKVFRHFEPCDEVWHAGDFGTIEVSERLSAFRPLRGVHGNIDGQDIRGLHPEVQAWTCEELSVLMVHIGGYPGRYSPRAKSEMDLRRPGLFISGHSHILKVMPDTKRSCLHINPGATGRQGWHKVRTIVLFTVDGRDIRDLSVVELGAR
jgi:putative phosphoesterase